MDLIKSKGTAAIRRLSDPTNLIINRLTLNTDTVYDNYSMRRICIWWEWYLGQDQRRNALVPKVRGSSRGNKVIRC